MQMLLCSYSNVDSPWGRQFSRNGQQLFERNDAGIRLAIFSENARKLVCLGIPHLDLGDGAVAAGIAGAVVSLSASARPSCGMVGFISQVERNIFVESLQGEWQRIEDVNDAVL